MKYSDVHYDKMVVIIRGFCAVLELTLNTNGDHLQTKTSICLRPAK